MINMMYLVLTALLALNVSAEILNAFILIDESLKTTTESVEGKIADSYNRFVSAEIENPVKVKPLREKADLVLSESDKLIEMIGNLKLKMVKTADGEAGDPSNIQKKDNSSVGGQIMIFEGGGEELKKAINEYREFLIESVGGDTSMASNFNSILNTDDVESSNVPGEFIDWATANFDHLPLIAVTTLMTKMQSDVRNAESNTLTYLLSSIGADTFNFDAIEGIISAPTSYVAVGEPYSAEIFIAASESTKDPVIYMLSAPYDSTKYTEYKKTLTPMDTSQIKHGKGILNGSTGAPGIKSIYGFIDMKMPSGAYEAFPFESKYQVVVPSFAVSPTKMNVFYIGVNNPVEISASGVKGDIQASISSGSISGSNGAYMVKVKKAGDVTITVSADGSRLGTKKFRCKTVPSPTPSVGGKRGGSISKGELVAQNYVIAELDNFLFDLKFPVTGFDVTIIKGGFVETAKSSSTQITAKQKGLIRDLSRGDKVIFENIKARAPDGSIRELGSLIFTLR